MSGSSVRIWLSGWAILQASDVRVAGLTTVPQPARQPSRRQWRRAAVSGPPLDAASLLPEGPDTAPVILPGVAGHGRTGLPRGPCGGPVSGQDDRRSVRAF